MLVRINRMLVRNGYDAGMEWLGTGTEWLGADTE
jgi:hypothetical protein